jgi:hypothetical protein
MLTKLPYFDQYINNNSPKNLIDHRVDYSNEEYQYRPKGPVTHVTHVTHVNDVTNNTINEKETR